MAHPEGGWTSGVGVAGDLARYVAWGPVGPERVGHIGRRVCGPGGGILQFADAFLGSGDLLQKRLLLNGPTFRVKMACRSVSLKNAV